MPVAGHFLNTYHHQNIGMGANNVQGNGEDGQVEADGLEIAKGINKSTEKSIKAHLPGKSDAREGGHADV